MARTLEPGNRAQPATTSSQLRSYAVWDAGTRWFHWINAICVIALAVVGYLILNAKGLDVPNAGKTTLKTVHTWIGYVFVANLLWRIVWAFMGNRYAQWRAILPGGRGYLHALRSYVAAFLAGHPQHYLGHNPAGRIGVALLFALIIVQAVTGLVLAGTDIFYPPFGPWIAQWISAPGVDPSTLVPYSPQMYDATAYESMRALRKPFAVVHLYSFYALMVIVVLHVAAVVITEVREGGSIVSAMFTGRKIMSGRPEDADSRG
jgi:Ni/Fe-hydrogenase b-type cytochrome subunit